MRQMDNQEEEWPAYSGLSRGGRSDQAIYAVFPGTSLIFGRWEQASQRQHGMHIWRVLGRVSRAVNSSYLFQSCAKCSAFNGNHHPLEHCRNGWPNDGIRGRVLSPHLP
jgi:hypothetical protein